MFLRHNYTEILEHIRQRIHSKELLNFAITETSKPRGAYMPAKNETKFHDGAICREARERNQPSKTGMR